MNEERRLPRYPRQSTGIRLFAKYWGPEPLKCIVDPKPLPAFSLRATWATNQFTCSNAAHWVVDCCASGWGNRVKWIYGSDAKRLARVAPKYEARGWALASVCGRLTL